MKKVSGYISVRALGCYDYEFYVDDDATDEEIEQKVKDNCECRCVGLEEWKTEEEIENNCTECE